MRSMISFLPLVVFRRCPFVYILGPRRCRGLSDHVLSRKTDTGMLLLG